MKARRIGPLAAIVLVPSALLYLLHYLLFRDPRNVGFYTLMDLAFLPVQAILVSAVLEAFLARREAAARARKLGMVSGAFFSEVGDGLVAVLSARDAALAARKEALAVGPSWRRRDFEAAARASRALGSALALKPGDYPALASYLSARREFLLGLLENPLVLDHEGLTEALMAVFHAHDELRQRRDFASLPPSDLAHLGGDLERAYGALLESRLRYLGALKASYHFLYSLALRSDPLEPGREPLVTP